jgi:hypothetical protein
MGSAATVDSGLHGNGRSAMEMTATVGGSWILRNGLLGDSVLAAAVTTGLGLAVTMGLAMDVGNGRTGMFFFIDSKL